MNNTENIITYLSLDTQTFPSGTAEVKNVDQDPVYNDPSGFRISYYRRYKEGSTFQLTPCGHFQKAMTANTEDREFGDVIAALEMFLEQDYQVTARARKEEGYYDVSISPQDVSTTDPESVMQAANKIMETDMSEIMRRYDEETIKTTARNSLAKTGLINS